MATNFPTSVDNLTNPTATDPQNSPSHADQHANANDAIEAIETKVGTGASTPAANKIMWGTGAGASAWSLDFKDEDDMATNSATAVPSQQSVKAYSDADWIALPACTYASADDPTFTFTIAADVTSYLGVGMRIKLTQTTAKYFIVTAVAYSSPNTTVTIYGGTDYDLANAAITTPYYSSRKAPIGFPLDHTKWSVEVTSTSLLQQTNPTDNTWYNLGSFSISIPIGAWRVRYKVCLQSYKATSPAHYCNTTLSTANNSESDADFSTEYQVTTASYGQTLTIEKVLVVAAKTSYYLNARSRANSLSEINFRGDVAKTIITATSTYL